MNPRPASGGGRSRDPRGRDSGDREQRGRSMGGRASGGREAGDNGRRDRAGGSQRPRYEQVEGRQAVRELLRARSRAVHEVWFARGLPPAPILDEIRTLAKGLGTAVREVPAKELEVNAKTDAPQGVLARAAPLPIASEDDLFSNVSAFVVALDGVTDPRNLGAVLRSAEGAGVTGLLLPRHRSAQITPVVTKAAAGAVEHVPIVTVAGLPGALERAKRAGLWIVGLDGSGDQSLFDFDLADQPLVLVFGAEGRGLSQLTHKRCDIVVNVPMLGALDSLNVSAAATLACYEVARRRQSAAKP